MTSQPDTQSLKPTFTFNGRGLTVRDDFLLKAIVRILDGTTKHTWVHSEAAHVNLLVVGSDADAGHAVSPVQVLPRQLVIVIKPAGTTSDADLSLPLRAPQLLRVLDRLGGELEVLMAQEITESPTAAIGAAGTPGAIEEDRRRFSLSRWPSADLSVGKPHYFKIAAALSGKPATVATLARQSGTSIAECQIFLDRLAQRGVLRISQHAQTATPPSFAHAPVPTAAVTAPPAGLFSRIRARLGLGSARNTA